MTSKPVLYYTQRSGPSRSVLLAAAEIGVELDLRIVNMKDGEHFSPEFLKMNPQHTVPVLKDNDLVVSDSHVICTYLADKYSTNEHLFPKEIAARHNVMTRLFFNCGHLFARVRAIIEPVFYFGCTEIPQDKIDHLQKAYDGLENCLKEDPYVCGKHLTIADLCCLSSISTAHDLAPIDEKQFPNLFAWLERMKSLPYYQKCNGDGAAMLKNGLFEKLEENRKAQI